MILPNYTDLGFQGEQDEREERPFTPPRAAAFRSLAARAADLK